ncbi:hypothetical protein FQZ97_991120 [compost metagenome]
MPVVDTKPSTAASPWSCVSRSRSARVQPACARAVRPAGSTQMPRSSDMSIIRPPSLAARPAMLWPPERTDSNKRCWAAKRTACTTSTVPLQRAISPGRRSIMPFQSFRVSSKAASCGVSSTPLKPVLNVW